MFTAHVNPTNGETLSYTNGVELNNEALRLEQLGKLDEAERTHLQAIQVKETGLGADHITTALSYNGLGELYLTMQRLDKAELYLKKALRVRERSGPASDLAVTRDNLGRLFEMKGDLQAAEEIRFSGAPDNIACGNYNCPKISNPLKDLSRCTVCKAVLYCSRNCQVSDWKRHKKYCKARTGASQARST